MGAGVWMMVWLWAGLAEAAEPGASVELVPVQRDGADITVFVRADGQVFVNDAMVPDPEITPKVQALLVGAADLRVVVAAEGAVPYSRIQQVMELVRWARPEHLALELDGMKPLGEGPPVAGKVTKLGGLSEAELKDLKPKRHKFPQNPYANTSGFTAYALEQGEAKIGLTTLSVGVLPKFQLATAPVLDAAGMFNLSAKANLVRTGRWDGAIVAQYYKLPTWLLGAFTEGVNEGLAGTGTGVAEDAPELSAAGGYVGVGATASVQVLDPWSLHFGAYYARPSARGSLSLNDLPSLLFPGLEIPESDASLVAKVNGDALLVNLATDLRFNRRDSVWAWARVPVYARARGLVSADDLLEGANDLQLILAYGDVLNPTQTYSVAAGYMASWRHFEARVGLGLSAIPNLWLLQAFDLTYRFGGETRKAEKEVREGYKDQKRELKDREGVDMAPPTPPVVPKEQP